MTINVKSLQDRFLSLCGQNSNHFQHVTTTLFPGRGFKVIYEDCCPQHPNNNQSWGDFFVIPETSKTEKQFNMMGHLPIHQAIAFTLVERFNLHSLMTIILCITPSKVK